MPKRKYAFFTILSILVIGGCLTGTICAQTVFHVDTNSGDDITHTGFVREEAFKTIQRGIEAASNSDTVLVWPGVYEEEIDFMGKNILLQSAADAATIRPSNSSGIAVSFFTGEDAGSVLRNFVIRDSSVGIFIVGASPTIQHVTVVNNAVGLDAQFGSQPVISNSIFWDNINADLFQAQASYSCVERGSSGVGNFTNDPLFADPNDDDFHLRSEIGRFKPEDSDPNDPNSMNGEWRNDSKTSPCIDAGDPNLDPTIETQPNGGRINVGAYGATPFASMSLNDWPNAADVNQDGLVDVLDLRMLADQWLLSQINNFELNADIDEDGHVNMFDFSILNREWLWQAPWIN